MKLCKDCDHYYGNGVCSRSRKKEINLVTGEFDKTGELRNCYMERKAWFFGCGVVGWYFKERDETV